MRVLKRRRTGWPRLAACAQSRDSTTGALRWQKPYDTRDAGQTSFAKSKRSGNKLRNPLVPKRRNARASLEVNHAPAAPLAVLKLIGRTQATVDEASEKADSPDVDPHRFAPGGVTYRDRRCFLPPILDAHSHRLRPQLWETR